MRLEWIDDLLAVLDSGSLARAAERRFLTQSAFTRRVKVIEDSIGVTMFDRRRKPVKLLPAVATLEPELRDLSVRLHRLKQDLRLSESQGGRKVAIACQHALTATVSPGMVSKLAAAGEAAVRVRSANQDECLMLLLSGEADFAILYEVPDNRVPLIPRAFESVTIGADKLIPVCAPAMQALTRKSEVPAITYPPDVFFGQVFNRSISPRLPEGVTMVSRAETALTLAMLQFALSEIGIAWLPQSLVRDYLTRRNLVRVDKELPAQKLTIKLIRLSDEPGERSDRIWQLLTG